MNQIPNILSLLRLPLALLFLQSNVVLRAAAVIAAAVTDGLDGFLARRFNLISRLGTLIDPLTDKFFVFFVVGTLIQEGQLSYWEASAFFCRDLAVFLFGFFLLFSGRWEGYKIQSFWCGKITTSVQFVALVALTLEMHLPWYVFAAFVTLGVGSLIELWAASRVSYSKN